MDEALNPKWRFMHTVFVVILLPLVLAVCSGRGFCLTGDEEITIGIFESVAPSVVNITTSACDPEFFFCSTPSGSGSGSGIILKEDGIIVTNHHVVAKAELIQITLSDGRKRKGNVVASSVKDDMAIVRIDPGDSPLKPIALGDSGQLQVGEKVLAIGNPFGLGQTLSTGIVSMTGRNIRNGGTVLKDLIQISAAINPGNSGGALVNSKGELIGMNTAILSPTGSNVGIGFAIPVNRIKSVTPRLMNRWGVWLGWVLAGLIVYVFLRRVLWPR